MIKLAETYKDKLCRMSLRYLFLIPYFPPTALFEQREVYAC